MCFTQTPCEAPWPKQLFLTMLMVVGIALFWTALILVVMSYMTLWYVLALLTKRYDVVDSAWGLGFILIAWISLLLRDNFGVTQVISAALVSLWGMRLFIHIAKRNWRKSTDDSRYEALRTKWGQGANRKAYINIFLLQGTLLLAVSAPVIAIAFSKQEPNVISCLGWAVWLFGTAFETVADRQLATFLKIRPKGSHQIMDHGLWHYSRHPNYFGEITAWWGAAVVACSVHGWLGVLGAATITLLITKVSGIPLLEKRYDGNPAYEAYRKRTSVLIPLPNTQKPN